MPNQTSTSNKTKWTPHVFPPPNFSFGGHKQASHHDPYQRFHSSTCNICNKEQSVLRHRVLYSIKEVFFSSQHAKQIYYLKTWDSQRWSFWPSEFGLHSFLLCTHPYLVILPNSYNIPMPHTHTCLFCAQVTKSCSLIQDVTLSLMHSANKFANAMPVFVHTDNTKLAKS